MLADTKTRLLRLGTDTNFVIQVLAGPITLQTKARPLDFNLRITRTQDKMPTQDINNGKHS